MGRRVFLSAGEASGDAYGAAFVRELSAMTLGEPVIFEGLGGSRMREAGVNLVRSTARWGAISIVQSFRVGPRVLEGYLAARRRLAAGVPGLFVPIDFGFVNIRLARFARARGWKVLYFVPPGSWNRQRQGRDLPAITDAIATPFAWSAEMLNEAGAHAHWFGHPIRQLIDNPPSGLESLRSGVAVLPGSRAHEISENLPLIARSVARLNVPSVEFALASTTDLRSFMVRWLALAPGRFADGRSVDRFTVGDSVAVLRRARVAIVCSGTATLEAVLSDCPMVVVYRVSRLMELEAALIGFRRPRFISLPNILLDRVAVPELVQEDANPERLAQELEGLLVDGPLREAQFAAFRELDRLLGPRDAITQTARLANMILSPVQ